MVDDSDDGGDGYVMIKWLMLLMVVVVVVKMVFVPPLSHIVSDNIKISVPPFVTLLVTNQI